MKSNWKHALIAFTAVLAVGLVMAGIGGIMGGRPSDDTKLFPFSRFFHRDEDQSAYAASAAGASLQAPAAPEAPQAPDAPTAPDAPAAPTAAMQKLDVEIGAGQVSIVPGDRFSMTSNREGAVNARMDGDTFEVENSGERWTGNLEVTITVPRDAVLEEADLSIGAGLMTVTGLSCLNAELKVGAGQMVLEDVSCSAAAEIAVGAGQLKYEGALTGDLSLACDAGHVKLTIPRPEDFGYRVNCSMGVVKLGDKGKFSGISTEVSENENADTFFDITCNVGEVKVVFD